MDELTKINLETFFETKEPHIENTIRKEHGDIAFERLLDDLLDYFK